MKMQFLEDLSDGKKLKCRKVTFTKDSIIEFAKNFDPQQFHTDEDYAEKSLFKGLIASSLHTLSACTKVVVDAQDNIAILSGVGLDEVKLFHPVRPGDTLTVDAWWADIRRSESKPDRGLASVKSRVFNQNYIEVMQCGWRYLVKCRK